MCVLNGIMNSQQTKYQIFPLCEKSIIVKFYEEPYKVGSLENAIFKVIPLEIIDLHNLKKEDLKLYLSPETNQELFVTSTEVLPKSYVYSLGKIVLDILTDPFRRLTEISFQDISFNEEKSSINKI